MIWQTYPEYKPSEIEWLGKIPVSWTIMAFKRLGDFQAGAGFPDEEQGQPDEELPFYKVSDTNLQGNETFMVTHNNSITRETAIRLHAFIFPPETIVFAKVGAALLLNKRRILTRQSCIDNNVMGFMRKNSELKWIYYWMCSLDLGKLANPGAVPSINEGQLRDIPVPVPPIDEQRVIATFLDREMARIDALVEKKQRQIELLQEKRAALISHAVTKGINPNAKMKASGIEWLGMIPTNWNIYRLKYCVMHINQKADGSETELSYTGLEHIEPWTGKRIGGDESTCDGLASRYKQGDVLFGKLRPYLAKALRADEEGICTGELLVLRPRLVLQSYLFNYLLTRDFISIVDSSTYGAKMPRASWEYIGNLPMLVPPEDEQRSISTFLDRETAGIDALIEKVNKSIALIREYRMALISSAVTGKIDICKTVGTGS